MAKVTLLATGKQIDTGQQVVRVNQIIRMEGYDYDRYVVYRIEQTPWGCNYCLVNLRTKKFTKTDIIRPLSEKFGIGFYYNDRELQMKDESETLALVEEAAKLQKEEEEAAEKERERREQVSSTGRERLRGLVPDDAQAVIIARLQEDDSNPYTDYHGYSTARTVILGFSGHRKNLFPEMRRYAANFEGTRYLTEENKEYEHRENYSMGYGYYLGKSKYSGWIIEKESIGDRQQFIERYAYIAGDPANICLKSTPATGGTETGSGTVEVHAGAGIVIVEYSEKALAVFGDTKNMKDSLRTLGGRFNRYLTWEGIKQPGWVFSKKHETELRALLK